MALIKDIFGAGISGTLNQMVFYQRNGKTYVRALPVRRHKNDSLAQQRNKQRFGAMLGFAKQFRLVVIPRIWNHASRVLTGNQLFIKTNKGAFDAEGNIPDMKRVLLSVGKLPLPEGIVLKAHGEGSTLMDISWYPDYEGGTLAHWDELMAIGYGNGLFSDITATSIRRGDHEGSFELPALTAPLTHLYLFFCSLDKRNYSESICLELQAN